MNATERLSRNFFWKPFAKSTADAGVLITLFCVCPLRSEMSYPICLEVAGPLAMFTRPDTGGTRTSYPVPTWSACKGIFEAIAFLSSGDAWSCPTRVEVCKPRDSQGGSVLSEIHHQLRRPSPQGAGDLEECKYAALRDRTG
jgi:CRISPR-associated Cas5-like protein